MYGLYLYQTIQKQILCLKKEKSEFKLATDHNKPHSTNLGQYGTITYYVLF